jgi:hypothetical protein
VGLGQYWYLDVLCVDLKDTSGPLAQIGLFILVHIFFGHWPMGQ